MNCDVHRLRRRVEGFVVLEHAKVCVPEDLIGGA